MGEPAAVVWQAVEGWSFAHLIRHGVHRLPARDADPLPITVCGRVVRDAMTEAGEGSARCGQCRKRANSSEEDGRG